MVVPAGQYFLPVVIVPPRLTRLESLLCSCTSVLLSLFLFLYTLTVDLKRTAQRPPGQSYQLKTLLANDSSDGNEGAAQRGRPQGTIHFKEETTSLCHPFASLRASSERSEGSLAGERSFAALRMTLLNRLRLTRNTSSLKCIDHKGSPCWGQSRRVALVLSFANKVFNVWTFVQL